MLHFARMILVAAMLGVAALVPHTSVSAGQYIDPLTLNPPAFPPYTCMATGGGAICRADNSYSYGPDDTGIACGNGATAFDIYESGTVVGHRTRYYDLNGGLTKRVILMHYTSGQWSNPLTGAVVTFTGTGVQTDDLVVPGDFTTSIETITSEGIYTAGNGAPVFIATGRQVFNIDMSELYFSAGRNGFIAAFFQGDTSAFDAVCAALGAS